MRPEKSEGMWSATSGRFLLAQLGEIRQSAFEDESFRQFGVHAVETQNYGALDLCFPVSLASPQQTEYLTERPRKKSIDRIKEGNEKCPERREDGETRSRSRVGVAAKGRENDAESCQARQKASYVQPGKLSRATSYLNPKNPLENKSRHQRQDKEQPHPVPFEAGKIYVPLRIVLRRLLRWDGCRAERALRRQKCAPRISREGGPRTNATRAHDNSFRESLIRGLNVDDIVSGLFATTRQATSFSEGT